MRVFLSYHTSDRKLAEHLQRAIQEARPSIDVFLDQTHLRHGHFWQPSLFQGIASADAFLILVGNRIGDWQRAEYYEAYDKKLRNPDKFALVPIITADSAKGPMANLPGLSQLHWIESSEPTAPEAFAKILRSLDGADIPEPLQPWRTINPYRGLSALEEQDADFFFGRDAKVREVVHSIAAFDRKLITLIGNSGVGKTSLVQAGVMASLKRGRWLRTPNTWPERLKDSRGWAHIVIRPNDNPIRALVSAFASLWFIDPTDPKRFTRSDDWEKRLTAQADFSELIDATQTHFRELGENGPVRVLVYIDQGEELYSRNSRGNIELFSRILASGLSDDRIVMMKSLRSDFYGYLQANSILFPISERIDVPPLGAEELGTVLGEPAKILGVSFESAGIIKVLINDAKDQPGALPLLADFMTELWRRMQGRGDGILRTLEKGEVLQIGGSLARRADLFVQEHVDAIDTIRRLFTRLAIVHEGSAPTRRRVLLHTCTPPERRLAHELAAARWRLVVTGQDEEEGRYVEVAHEILLREWETLKFWLDDQRSFLLWKADIERLYKRWVATPLWQRTEALLFGLSLKEALRWNQLRPADVERDIKSFIIRSAETKVFGFWNTFIILASLLLLLPFLLIVGRFLNGVAPIMLGAIMLSVLAGMLMRVLAGVVFRVTVRGFDFSFRSPKRMLIGRRTLREQIEALQMKPSVSLSRVPLPSPPRLPVSAQASSLDFGISVENADRATVEARKQFRRGTIRSAIVGAFLGVVLFVISVVLIALSTTDRSELEFAMAIAVIWLLLAILLANVSYGSQGFRTDSSSAFMAGLLSAGWACLNLFARTGRVGMWLLLGVLSAVLCCYVLFVRWLGKTRSGKADRWLG